MSAPAKIWTPHLAAGERIVWSASVSPDLVRASLGRKRLIAGFTGLAGAILAALLTFRALESFFPAQTPPPGAMNLIGPIYAAFAIAMIVYTFGCLMRLNPRPPTAAHYAVTDRRILALDAAGAEVQALPAADYDGVRALEITRPPTLVISRKHDEAERDTFLIQFVERPLEAKAIIEETFPASAQ